jgi:hypothetical protein
MQALNVDSRPTDNTPHWPPPVLRHLEISAYCPPTLPGLPLEAGLIALASQIPVITWWVKSEVSNCWGSREEALPRGFMATRPDVLCVFKPNRIDIKRVRNGSKPPTPPPSRAK